MPFSGHRLQQARKNAGLTQTELSRQLGIVPQQFIKWEHQTAAPSAEYIARLAQALGCTTDWLLELVDEPTGHLYDTDLSEDERELIMLYRRGALPNLIQRLVIELAEGSGQKSPTVETPGASDVSSEEVAANR